MARGERREKSAFEAMCEAQRLACAPFEFEAAVCLRNFRILEQLDAAGEAGLPVEEIERRCRVSRYAAKTLLLAGRGAAERRPHPCQLQLRGGCLLPGARGPAGLLRACAPGGACGACARRVLDLPGAQPPAGARAHELVRVRPLLL